VAPVAASRSATLASRPICASTATGTAARPIPGRCGDALRLLEQHQLCDPERRRAAFTVGLPLVQPDGLSDDEIPGDLEEGSEPVVGGVLLWPNVSVGWAF